MRKISLITTSLLLGTVLFTGCAVKTGNDRIENVTQDNILSMIEDGKSTKADVRKAFGEPRNIDFMDNGSFLTTIKSPSSLVLPISDSISSENKSIPNISCRDSELISNPILPHCRTTLSLFLSSLIIFILFNGLSSQLVCVVIEFITRMPIYMRY